ncbi:MAG: adenylyl-sulfate kinase [Candidatus Cloacimonetes bacterium]|nr:adenylyl-sulfate kinase [Candidatus Cloacimonadota bacterium]
MNNEVLHLVIVGHVDHGKSTVIGRLLCDTNSLPLGKLDSLKKQCKLNSKAFEYAFLLDALKDEQSQGITIDTARVFFQSLKRKYLILDAPGHIEFLKNMVSGAAKAEAALLVIDALEGVQENTKRHAYILSLLGVKQIAVVINKMDLVDYKEDRFHSLVKEMTQFLKELGLQAQSFIPISAFHGENLVESSSKMPWYKAYSILEQLDQFEANQALETLDFRLPVQDVYKFTNYGDQDRLIVGQILSGQLSINDEVHFYPSGKKTRVKSIPDYPNQQKSFGKTGESIAFSMSEQIYIKRGEVAVKQGQTPPLVSSTILVNLFYMGKKPIGLGSSFDLKSMTQKVTATIIEIKSIFDSSNLSTKTNQEIVENSIVECIIDLSEPIAFDSHQSHPLSSRFVVVMDYEICGGGVIKEGVKSEKSDQIEKKLIRNLKWENSQITRLDRSKKYGQAPTLIIVTGPKDSGKKPLAKLLETKLFEMGKFVYFLGIGNVLYGVDADIKDGEDNRSEHIRRYFEVLNLLLNSGLIVITTAIDLTQKELNQLKTQLSDTKTIEVYMGQNEQVLDSALYKFCDRDFVKQSEEIIKQITC